MKKLLIAMMFVLSFGACAMPIEPATDSDPQGEVGDEDVEGVEQATQVITPPYQLLAFAKDFDGWNGSQAGQVYTRWGSGSSASGGMTAYNEWQDGQIQVFRVVATAPGNCTITGQASAYCTLWGGGQSFTCPQYAIIGEPAAWRDNTAANWSWGGIMPPYFNSFSQVSGTNPSIVKSLINGNQTNLTCYYAAPALYMTHI